MGFGGRGLPRVQGRGKGWVSAAEAGRVCKDVERDGFRRQRPAGCARAWKAIDFGGRGLPGVQGRGKR
jgi:hypothetical protein